MTNLKPEAHSKERLSIDPGPIGGHDFAFDSSFPESSGDEDSVGAADALPSLVEFHRIALLRRLFQVGGLHVFDHEFVLSSQSGVAQSFANGSVSVLQPSVLSDESWRWGGKRKVGYSVM